MALIFATFVLKTSLSSFFALGFFFIVVVVVPAINLNKFALATELLQVKEQVQQINQFRDNFNSGVEQDDREFTFQSNRLFCWTFDEIYQ